MSKPTIDPPKGETKKITLRFDEAYFYSRLRFSIFPALGEEIFGLFFWEGVT